MRTTKDQVMGMLSRLNRDLEEVKSDGRFIVTSENGYMTIREKSGNGVVLSGLTKNQAYNFLYAMSRAIETIIYGGL